MHHEWEFDLTNQVYYANPAISNQRCYELQYHFSIDRLYFQNIWVDEFQTILILLNVEF